LIRYLLVYEINVCFEDEVQPQVEVSLRS